MYVVHGTTIEGLHAILCDGVIRADPPRRNTKQDDAMRLIFCQLLFDIDNIVESTHPAQVAHQYAVGIILDRCVLRDLPFYIKRGMGGFEDNFEAGYRCHDVLAKGRGGLKIMPRLKRAVEYIKSYVRKMRTQLGHVSLFFSHEVIFSPPNGTISLYDYCIAIVVPHDFQMPRGLPARSLRRFSIVKLTGPHDVERVMTIVNDIA